MKEKLAQFMVGRYGIDRLYRFLLLTGLVCLLLSAIVGQHTFLGGLLNTAALALLVWAVFRVLSKNTQARYMENLHYLEKMGAVQQKLRMRKEIFQQRKEYKFFVCPNCKTNLRVPKGKGKVHITCGKCGTRFQGKT